METQFHLYQQVEFVAGMMQVEFGTLELQQVPRFVFQMATRAIPHLLIIVSDGGEYRSRTDKLWSNRRTYHLFVVHSRVELLFIGWKPIVLTARRMDHLIILVNDK